jgi:hypothetical protein
MLLLRLHIATLLLAARALATNATNSSGLACEPGTWCANPNVTEDTMVPCAPAFYCPGNQSAQMCPAGSWCRSTTSIEPCPEGYYCPPLTYVPIGEWAGGRAHARAHAELPPCGG